MCIALDHSGSVCSHSLSTGDIDGPGTGERQCTDCPEVCQNSCRNGSYGIFEPCNTDISPNTTGYDNRTCCFLFDHLLGVAKGVVEEVSKNGRPAEFSIVGFGTSAFYQYPNGTTSNLEASFFGSMLNASDALTTIENSDYNGGFTNHDDAIRWW